MALFVHGMPCAICRKPIQAGDAVVAFSPFVANKKDALHLFSDAVLHQECFESHPLAERARARHEEVHRVLGDPAKRICRVCGSRIEDPDDYFTTGFLADDGADPLSKYNFVQLHRSHLASWSELEEFRRLLEDLEASGAWDGPFVL